MKNTLILILFFCCIQFSVAQFNILNRVANRIENKLEDKIVETLADEIYKRAFRPVDQAIEDAIKRGLDSTGMTYEEYEKSMNTAYDKLPAQYSFDLVCDSKTIDPKKKTSQAKQYYTKQGNAVGYESLEKNERNIVIFDVQNDIMIMLREEKGKKTGQIIPSIGRITMALVTPKMEESMKKLRIEKSGKNATIAGFPTEEYLMIDESKNTTKMAICNNFPITYAQAYGKFFKSLVPTLYTELPGIPTGFCLRSEIIDDKKTGSYIYEIEKVTPMNISFAKGDYSFKRN